MELKAETTFYFTQVSQKLDQKGWNLAQLVGKLTIYQGIMIKSSDKKFNNTYRLQRVLANKDYLATDYNHSVYLFCQAPHYLHHYCPRVGNKYLLLHRQCIVVDHLKYFVFEAGTSEPSWIGNLDKKKLGRAENVLALVQHAVFNILSWLLWNNPKEAVQWLDIRNCWLFDGNLSIIQLPRFRNVSFSLKRSQQHHSSLNSASFTTVLQTEEALLRRFGLLLWQIIEQRPYIRGDMETSGSKFIGKLLRDMIHNQIRFEQVENRLKNTGIDKVYKRKLKLRSITMMDIERRRGSSQQSSVLNKYSSFNQSKLQKIYTKVVNKGQSSSKDIAESRFRKDILKRQQRSQEVNAFCKGCTFTLANHPRPSLPVSLQKTPYRKNHRSSTVQTNIFANSTQSTAKYVELLKSKKHSLNIQKKIERQQIIAQNRFDQTRYEDSRGTISQFDEEKLKMRLLSKVIRFKSQRKSIPLANNSTVCVRTNDGQQASVKQQLPSNKMEDSEPQLKMNSNIKQQLSEGGLKMKIQKDKTQSEMSMKKEVKLSIQKVNNFMITPSSLLLKPQQPNQKQVSNTKQQKAPPQNRKLRQQLEHQKADNVRTANEPRIKKENILSAVDEQFQVIVLDKVKRQQRSHQPVQNILFDYPSQDKPTVIDYAQVVHMVNEFVTMINILGDITVTSVKIKDNLTLLNWRVGSYFLYQRFYYERGNLLKGLRNNSKSVVRKHHPNIQKQIWTAWANSKQKLELISKMEAENGIIRQTLNRFGQKILKEVKIEKKMEHYFKAKEKEQISNRPKLRLQLSSLAVKYIVDEFDTMVQKKMNVKDTVNHVIDCLFGLRIIRELDGLAKEQVQLGDYKHYKYDLGESSRLADELYDLYLPDQADKV